jgi:putative phosphoribosyl transferase
MPFRDRRDAGRRLAAIVGERRLDRPIVLALPRGGVPVGAEVARRLDAPFDVLIVRKLGSPENPELGVGAVAPNGVLVLDSELAHLLHIPEDTLDQIAASERAELRRRDRVYRGERPFPRLDGRCVVVVDDGVATGGSARAAAETARSLGAARIVLAVPVAPPETVAALEGVFDDVIALETPVDFGAVGRWYDDFRATSDEEVRTCLAEFWGNNREGRIPVDGSYLAADVVIPAGPRGVVIFAHGSGSNRWSPRNREVAEEMVGAGLAAVLVDLLTESEAVEDETTRDLRFDIGLLAGRLERTLDWVLAEPELRGLPVGLFGSSTGAAAALRVAACRPEKVRAVVSRGGRVDLAREELPNVRSPVLLLVGERDPEVLALNKAASGALAGEVRLIVVPRASHLFEEPGAMEQVAAKATEFLLANLKRPHESLAAR